MTVKNHFKFVFFITLVALIFAFSECKIKTKQSNMRLPVAKKIAKELTIHGDTRIDNYFWLNDRNNPEVISYLETENNYTDEVMKDTKDLQEKLYNEIIGRIKQTDESVPYRDNGYYYYTRFEEGKEYPVYCRKKGSLEAEEEILLDGNKMAEGHSYFQIGGIRISPDNEIMAYSIDTVSRRKYTLYFKNLKTGEIYDETIPVTTGGGAWANDNKTYFYTQKDEETLRSHKIFKHKLGTSVIKDSEIYHEADETFGTTVYRTKSDRYIIIASYSTLSNEYRFVDAANPDDDFKIIQPRTKDLEYSVDHVGDYFYIITNYQAKNFRLMKTPVSRTSLENWQEVIPHRDSVMLEDIEIFKKYLVVSERKNGLTHLRVINWKTDQEYYVDFGEEVYTAGVSMNPEFDTDILRYGYTSLTTPVSTFDFNMNTKERQLMKQQEVVGDFDPANYEAKRLYATAKDGIQIPISLVYRKGMQLNGKNNALLYGYGSYGHTIDPYFSSVRLSLLDRGFVFAIAHIRGGQINGRQWYEDGKLLKKKNTFTDFNACAEKIIEDRYTSPEHLYAMGGSAGGLLMGAIINLQPELYKGVIAAVPFVDVVTTMLDESIPLTTGEFDEWGNPKDKTYYEYIKSYSPYDNVQKMAYPNLLVTTGLHDSQVQYWEPAKWVAKLRDTKTDNNILLLHTNMEAGHGGASGRFRQYHETALEYAFLLKLSGIKD